MSTKKKLGARAGKAAPTWALMVALSKVTVAAKFSPSPKAVTTPPVAAPGLIRLAKASRTKGDLGRGKARMARRSPSASSRNNPSAAMAPTRNSAANRGEGATIKVRMATQSAAVAEIAQQAGGRYGAGPAQRRHGKSHLRQQSEGQSQ